MSIPTVGLYSMREDVDWVRMHIQDDGAVTATYVYGKGLALRVLNRVKEVKMSKCRT